MNLLRKALYWRSVPQQMIELKGENFSRKLRHWVEAMLFYLGKSFELDQDYLASEEAYLGGFDKKYRAAIFRLAMLHGRGLARDSDRNFYLLTVRALSREGHFPSIALYTNERIRGSYGLIGRIFGFLSILPNLVRYLWNFSLDSRSHDFEQ
jgi:hypothetical protein